MPISARFNGHRTEAIRIGAFDSEKLGICQLPPATTPWNPCFLTGKTLASDNTRWLPFGNDWHRQPGRFDAATLLVLVANHAWPHKHRETSTHQAVVQSTRSCASAKSEFQSMRSKIEVNTSKATPTTERTELAPPATGYNDCANASSRACWGTESRRP